jgi:PAS domain S-box-containing protein
MPRSEPITILIVNEHAEEIKLVTISLRNFFSDVRIEAAYSAEEADRITQAATDAWAVALIDDAVLPDLPSTFMTDLKGRMRYASMILQSSRTDSRAAHDALDMGADLLLYKPSPAFLTELLLCTRQAIENRERRLAAERAERRHAWLIESLGDVLYELDAEGRFLSLSPNLPALLGYRPEELIGRPYMTLFSEAEQRLARFRFNERRAGERAAEEFEVTLQGKAVEGMAHRPACVSARGVYDASRRFLGTIGLIRDLSHRTKEQAAQQALLEQRQRAEELQTVVRQMTDLSERLDKPLSSLVDESQQLADSLRKSRILERLHALSGYATASAELAQRLAHLARPPGPAHIVNRLLNEVLQTASTAGGTSGIIPEFGAALPVYAGNPEITARFFRQLLAYADAYLATVGRPHTLAIKTGDSADAPAWFSVASFPCIQLDITETDTPNPFTRILPLPDPFDVPTLYKLAGDLGATLDVSAPASGPFRMIVRLPAGAAPASRQQKLVDVPPVDQMAEVPRTTTRSGDQDPIGAGPPDRRSNARVPTGLTAKITRGASLWEGTVTNISIGGAGIRAPEDFPPLSQQEAIIWVTTGVATLELHGHVHTRPPSASKTHRSIQPGAHLIVQFIGPNQTETAVLASLIEAAHERSVAFSLDIHLPIAAGVPHREGPAVFDLVEYDRRETIRMPTALSARLETTRRPESGTGLKAQVVNLSRSGACVVLQERPEALEGTIDIHFAAPHRGESGSLEPGAPDATLAARVVWSVADQASGAFQPLHGASAVRAGVRFEPLTPYAERELNRVMRQHLRAQRAGDAFPTAPVVSVPRECRNARGQTIVIADDHLSQLADPNCPTIIITPGYGQTASDYAALSFYLAGHALRVLRYDPTNHLGNSEGELQHTTLRGMQHDLEKVMEFVRHTWPQAPVVVIASDLASRAALKTAAHARPLALLLLVNPTIDVMSLLLAVHGHDLIADYQFGLRHGVCNLFGLNVNLDQFVGDLIAGRSADLESTLGDLRLILSPLCIATSPVDSTAFPPTDLPHAFMTALGANAKLVNIASPVTHGHLEVSGPPPAAFRQLLEQIAAVVPVQTMSPEQEIAALSHVAQQHRMEQEDTFLRHDGSQINREALCAAHLAQLPHLGNLHEYRKLLDDLYGLMSPLEPGAVLVDAGVGQSDLTRAALVNHTYRAGQATWTGRPSPLIIGVGRSLDRIGQARHTVAVLQRELATGFVGRLSAMPPLATAWVQADWRSALPLKTGSVNRLVCNLSLPYVPSPLTALREWHRALHPDGSLIFTAFHPNTDLSPLYRRHLRQANQDEFSAQAQPVLHYCARLREGIRQGILHTFDEARLAALLKLCGMASFRILPIFDGQALVVIVGKQNSSGSPR